MPSFICYAPGAPGGYYRMTSRRGGLSFTISGSGAERGYGSSSMTRCGEISGRPKAVSGNRARAALIVNRSRRPKKGGARI